MPGKRKVWTHQMEASMGLSSNKSSQTGLQEVLMT